ncbi:hypothetical protein [Hyphomonas chukchiensis]|uniref:Uncharacterized protein n=1 Tax=Hyphomonas chukchiensis TaxID=1280947 RepID=A0A062TZH6_9PROT|nr:hypothetical protein [Hyphomonas chukchiensis]KCZ53471.1 hypothetical protein HY30_10885 [Hyphomonas chukchiensis]
MSNQSATPASLPTPAYADGSLRTHIKRVKLGLFLSSLAACLGVSVIGGLMLGFVHILLGVFGMNATQPFQSTLTSGIVTGLQLAALNFVLFLVTVPAAWLALGLSIGRMPHRRIAARAPYIRWGAIWGAILVGGTTFAFGLIESIQTGIGALLSGASVGALAGVGCGFLFYAIVRPAEQLRDVDISVF